MRLSSTITLSLLAFDNVSKSSAFKQTTAIERRMRMLQKKEVGGTSSSPRKLSKGSEKKGGNKSSRSGDKDGDKKGRKGGDDTKKGVNGRYDGKDSKKSHTAHLDANENGITTDSTEYTYGMPINVSFELTKDLVIGDAGTNDRRRLDGLDVNTLQVGLFMRMANPQDGALEPIMKVTPTIVVENDESASTTVGGSRMLKGTRKKEDDKKKKVAQKKGGPTAPDPKVPTTTTINLSGTATFTATDIISLDPDKYGLGFDAYLLDESGSAIIGPATFYEGKSQEMIVQAAAEVAIKMAEQAESAIVKYNPTKMKHKGGKKENTAMMAQAMGIGSGKDGESMIIATTERLADYRLDTDAMYYVNGDDITATFDLHQDVVSDSGRMLQQKPWGRKKKKNNNKNKNNKKKKKKKKKKPKKPSPTTTTTIATTAATSTQAPDTTQAPPETTSTVFESTTSESPPQTTDAPEEETTTSQATVLTTSQATSPASTTTVISTDGSTQAAPEAPETTTTEAPPEVDMAADDVDETLPEDNEMEDEVEIDADDVRLFSLGIFMRMANPQDGKLSPIHSIPFCPDPEDCKKKSDELESGTFKFSSLELNMEENGSGYDVWVLNGRGEGVAGPHTFYVEKQAAIEV